MSDKSKIQEFISNEKQKLYNIQTGLTTDQQIRYNPQIREILILLEILQKQKLSPSLVKEIEQKIKNATDQLGDTSKKAQILRAKNYALISNIKPNIKSVPLIVRQKAQMAKASGMYHDNNGNVDSTQSYLDQMEVPYKIDPELSNQDSLVLFDKDNNVKVAYRGTKWNNLEDIKGNMSIAAGYDENSPQYMRALEQMNNIKSKYGELPTELVSFSKGSALGLRMGEKFGIDTTNFNPFLGKGLIGAVGNSKNTIFRTTTDMPSLGVALKTSNPNYDLQVIEPVKASINPVKAHSLDNFIDTTNIRLNSAVLEAEVAKVHIAGAKHGEAQLIADMASAVEGTKPIKVSSDLYNVKAKAAGVDPNNPHLTHDYNDDSLYQVGEQVEQIGGSDIPMDVLNPDALPRAVPLVGPPAPSADIDDATVANWEDRMNALLPDTTSAYPDLPFADDYADLSSRPLPEPPSRPLPETPQIKSSKDPLGDQIRAYESNVFDEIETPIPPRPLPEIPQRKDPLGDEIKSREKNIFDEEPTELGEGADDFSPEEMEAYDGLLNKNKNITFSEFIHDYNSQKGIDTRINPDNNNVELNSSRMHKNSRWTQLWGEATNGDFTNQELEHFEKYNDTPADDLYLSDQERLDMYNATPEERHDLVKQYEQDSLDAQQNLDQLTGIESEDGSEMRGLKNAWNTGAKNFLTNFGIGAFTQWSADQAVNLVDPNHEIQQDTRVGFSGFLGGGAGEAAILKLGGSAITGAAILPVAIGASVGNIVGSRIGQLIEKEGGSELEQDVGSASAGVGSAVYATGVAAAAGSALFGAEEGATLGSVLLPGVGTLVGLGVGGIIGLGAYGLSKGFNALKSLF